MNPLDRESNIQRAATWAGVITETWLSTLYAGERGEIWWRDLESPLEEAFTIWWVASGHIRAMWNLPALALAPQQDVTAMGRRYRLDFVVKSADARLLLAVELDGHAFHERTREQVAQRDQRDRDLQAAGWRVFHFSYSEFVAHPWESVNEVQGYATQVLAGLVPDVNKAVDNGASDEGPQVP